MRLQVPACFAISAKPFLEKTWTTMSAKGGRLTDLSIEELRTWNGFPGVLG
jgi:hypothetical protein